MLLIRQSIASTPEPPEGFDCVRLGRALAWTRPETTDWVERALERHGTIYVAARHACAGDARLEGRGPVYVVPSSPRDRVVRHYARGGMVASLLGDRYLRVGISRPFREALASERLRHNGLCTPKVLAAAVYPTGPIYRGDLVTEYVSTDGDLARLLFEEPRTRPDRRTAALMEVGATLERMSHLGALHADANAKNFLVDLRASRPVVHLLDLDRCRFGRGTAKSAARKMGDRLIGSLKKWERLSAQKLTVEEWGALREGLEGRTPASRGG